MTSSLEAAKFRNVASHYKEAEPLTSNDSAEVAKAFQSINKCSPLMWPQLLQVDPGREFMGSVTKEMENHKTVIGSAIHCCVERRQRYLLYAHSIYLVALASQDVHTVTELLSLKQRLFVLLILDLFFYHNFFTPFAFLMFSFSSTIENIFGHIATASAITLPAHSSFILPNVFRHVSVYVVRLDLH